MLQIPTFIEHSNVKQRRFPVAASIAEETGGDAQGAVVEVCRVAESGRLDHCEVFGRLNREIVFLSICGILKILARACQIYQLFFFSLPSKPGEFYRKPLGRGHKNW